jgi:hypothetical protein
MRKFIAVSGGPGGTEDNRRTGRRPGWRLGGTEYEIDLSTKNATAFRRQLAPFIEHARKTGRGQRRRPGQTASSRERSAGIRAWAKDQGITVSDRGRIPASVAEQYDAATKGR